MKKLNCILLSLVYLLGTCSITSCGKLTYEESKNKLKENFKVEDYLYLKDFNNSDIFEKFKYCYESAITYYEPSEPYLKTTEAPNVVDYWEENRHRNNFLYCFSTTEGEYFIENSYTFYHFWALQNKRILIFPNKKIIIIVFHLLMKKSLMMIQVNLWKTSFLYLNIMAVLDMSCLLILKNF